jgi:hypothetical protein
MSELINRVARNVQLWCYRKNEICQFDGIRLADLKGGPHFREILLAALRLLQATDLRRFQRVRKHLFWVVRTTLSIPGLAVYNSLTRACEIDFLSPSSEFDAECLIGWYACTLVHEATHGVICSRGIAYTPKLRSRIEHICVKEEQRFLFRLTFTQPDLADRLYREFDASHWKESWSTTPRERLRVKLRRILLGLIKRDRV